MIRELLCRLGRHSVQEMDILVGVESGHRLRTRALGMLHREHA